MKTEKVKKPFYKRWWFWLIVIIVIAGAFGPKNTQQQPAGSLSPAQSEAPAPTDIPALAESLETREIALALMLNSDDPGDYGKIITLNEGTEDEYSFIGFYLPAGHYRVSNASGKVATQISFCKDGTVRRDDGVEETITAEQRPIVLNAGESSEFDLEEGQYIKLADGSTKIVFELLK